MVGTPGDKVTADTFTDEEWAWIGENMPKLRREVSDQRILSVFLGIAFVVGLAAHAGGYLLKSGASTGLLGLLADLLYTLGWALWTGVVVSLFVQVLPEAKRRSAQRALKDYEAVLRQRAKDRSGEAREDGPKR